MPGAVGRPTRLAERYRLRSEIAGGPRALVWLAIDERLDRLVAVKFLRPAAAADPDIRSGFVDAAHASARLSHPNIVRVFDTGEHEGIPYLVMEYMEGSSLERLLERGPLSAAQVAVVGEAVSASLAHAHSEGIAHGNLKPSNVLLTAQGHTKVSDFALGKLEGEEWKADLVALGKLLYESLVGRPPSFARRGRGLRPSDFRPDTPRGLDAVVMGALETERGPGFAGAAEMNRALAELASHDEEPVPDSARTRDEPAASSSFVRTEGRWLLRTALVVALATGVTIAALNLSQPDTLTDLFGKKEQQRRRLEVVSPSTYDPESGGGNGEENTQDAAKAFDDDPKTSWSTEWYRTPDLGGAKRGVGLVFDLPDAVLVERVEIVSVEGGWLGSIRHSDDGLTWSEPRQSAPFGREESKTVESTHRHWMIWITRLVITPGQGRPDLAYSVGISEVRAFGR